MATTVPAPPHVSEAPALDPAAGQKAWAKIWIAHGVFWLALMTYVYAAWVVSGDFETNTYGRDDAPAWYVITVRSVEIVVGVFFTGWIVWHFIVRPKLRTGSFSFDGLFFIGCFLMVFQEPWMNWINLQFLYGTTFVNFGFWGPHIPGWSLPNAELIPMPLVYFAAYLWMVGFGGWAASRYMARQRRRDPSRSVGRIVWQTFGVIVLVDLIVEGIMVHTELISYPRTISEVTIWAGADHQFPLYEALIWPSTFILIASMHFFRDDHGRSFVERGIDKLNIRNGKLLTLARFAAIAGFCQLAILVTFNIPYQIIGLHADAVPQAFQKKDWRMGGVCGPRTAYDCGGPGVLMPRHDTPTNRVVPKPDATTAPAAP